MAHAHDHRADAITAGLAPLLGRFGSGRLTGSGPERNRWLVALPALIEALTERWRLTLMRGAWHCGHTAVVVPVRRDARRLALRLAWPAAPVALEAAALSAWRGEGAVMLVEALPEQGALLLEWLNSSSSLMDEPLDGAAAIAAGLLHRLAVPAPPGLPELAVIAAGIATSVPVRQAALGDPVPARWLGRAITGARELAAGAGALLVHSDLHYGNVLRAGADRGHWLAVDPRPVSGDPEYAVPELLWTRLDEAGSETAIRRLLALLVDVGRLDADRARGWAVVRAVDYWLWGREHGLTDDPERCRRLLDALAG